MSYDIERIFGLKRGDMEQDTSVYYPLKNNIFTYYIRIVTKCSFGKLNYS